MTTDTPRTDDQFPWKAECPRMSNYCDKHLRGYWRNVGSPWHGVIKEAFEIEKELNASKTEVERLRGLLNAHAEFLIKNGFYRESRDLMGGSWSDGFIALAKKCGINPYDQ